MANYWASHGKNERANQLLVEASQKHPKKNQFSEQQRTHKKSIRVGIGLI